MRVTFEVTEGKPYEPHGERVTHVTARATHCTWALCTFCADVSSACDFPRLRLALVLRHVERGCDTGVTLHPLHWSQSCRTEDPVFMVVEGL